MNDKVTCWNCHKKSPKCKTELIEDVGPICKKCMGEWTKEQIRIDRLVAAGHDYHCACRIVWGDGECECSDESDRNYWEKCERVER